MTWTWLDCVIVALFVSQIIALIAIGRMILRIKSGPVDGLIGRGRSLAEHGKGIAESGKAVFEANRGQAMALIADASGLASSLRGGAKAGVFATEAITYGKLLGFLGTAQKLRKGFGVAGALRRGGVKAALAHGRRAPSPGKPRQTFAERLGLIPPAAKKLAPLFRFAKTAFGVHRQLRSRGLL